MTQRMLCGPPPPNQFSMLPPGVVMDNGMITPDSHHQQHQLMPGPAPHLHPGSMVSPRMGMQPMNMFQQQSVLSHPQGIMLPSADMRVHEMNKRLQVRPENNANFWWEHFATEFFEDDATMTLDFMLEDGHKSYTIGRTLIPRYFASIFDGCVVDLYLVLRGVREMLPNGSITLDCERAEMVTTLSKPVLTNVVTEGRLFLEFSCDDLMRLRTWRFNIRGHREMVPRALLAVPNNPNVLDQISKNVTRAGITMQTLNFLRLCVILEPMQSLMSRQKAYGLHPRDALKQLLFQRWQRICVPLQENATFMGSVVNSAAANGSAVTNKSVGVRITTPASKRRKRKNSSASSAGAPPLQDSAGVNALVVKGSAGGNGKRNRQQQNSQTSSLNTFTGSLPLLGSNQSGDVMIVGEPNLMGGDLGEEDERLICRLENNHFDNVCTLSNDAKEEMKIKREVDAGFYGKLESSQMNNNVFDVRVKSEPTMPLGITPTNGGETSSVTSVEEKIVSPNTADEGSSSIGSFSSNPCKG